MPHFSPARLERMEAQMRELAIGMINEFKDKGEVDVAWDFGRVYPVRIFMGLMGFPAPMFEQFLDWEWDILHSGSRDKMAAALRGVLQFPTGIHRRESESNRTTIWYRRSSTVRLKASRLPRMKRSAWSGFSGWAAWIPSRPPSARCFAAWRCIRASSSNYAAILSSFNQRWKSFCALNPS
jgi:hypothetical protein